MKFTLKQIAHFTGGEIIQGDERIALKGISTNSRAVRKGELFIALIGEKFDGHNFLAEVAAQNAAAVIVSRTDITLPRGIGAVRVKDTVKALGRIARAYRDQFKIPVIGITGSAGKTTTKEMLARVLSAKYKVLNNPGTENNHIGVPLTLLKLRPSHDIAIIEMGTNRFGDIPWLVEVAAPTMAILTNIGESHLALLKSPQDVFREKSALIRAVPPQGRVLINTDDKFLRAVPIKDKTHKLITYGIHNKADFQARDIRSKSGKLYFKMRGGGEFVLAAPVPANVYNALVAISCGRAFNINYNVIRKRLAGFRIKNSRQSIARLGKFWIIDDTYNANPVSFKSALNTLALLECRGRRILVCADMRELGEQSELLHRAVGEFAAAQGVAAVFSFGNFSRHIGLAAKSRCSAIEIFHGESLEEIQPRVRDFCRPGDAILIKGSRGMRMERMVAFLKQNFSPVRGE